MKSQREQKRNWYVVVVVDHTHALCIEKRSICFNLLWLDRSDREQRKAGLRYFFLNFYFIYLNSPPHVSEAASANPKPWGFNSDWSRSYGGCCWNCTPPVNVSISLKSPCPTSPAPPLLSVRPRKSRVRWSVLCHLAISPDVKPPM